MVMEDDIKDKAAPCLCYKETCKNCPNGFEKVLELKDAGLVIYRHSIKPTDVLDQNTRIDIGDDKNGFIFHNTKDADIESKDYLPEMEKRAIKCVRCRQIVEQAINILQKVSAISKNEIIGICDHCKFKRNPCYECEGALKKFFDSKREVKVTFTEDTVREWLQSVRSEFRGFDEVEKESDRERLKDYVAKGKHPVKNILKARSEVHIDQLCNRSHDKNERQLEIKELCRQPIEPSFKIPYSVQVPDKNKKKILFKFGDQPEIVDSVLKIPLDRKTKSAQWKTKEPPTNLNEDLKFTTPTNNEEATKNYGGIDATYPPISETRGRAYYEDDVGLDRFPKQYAHDNESITLNEEEIVDDSKPPKSGFIFSFPSKKRKGEPFKKDKQLKSSSELISDIQNRIQEEIRRKDRENKIRQIKQEEKDRVHQEKIWVSEENKALAAAKNLAEQFGNDVHKESQLFDKSYSSMKNKTLGTASQIFEQSKSLSDQKDNKSKLQTEKTELNESKLRAKGTKSESSYQKIRKSESKHDEVTELSSKTDRKKTKPDDLTELKSDLTSFKTERKKNKADEMKELKSDLVTSKTDRKKVKPDELIDLKSDLVSSKPKAESKQPREPEQKIEPKHRKYDLDGTKQKPKGELKDDWKKPKADSKIDSKKSKVETNRPMPDTKTDLKHSKTQTKSDLEKSKTVELKPESKDINDDVKTTQSKLYDGSKKVKAVSKQAGSKLEPTLKERDVETRKQESPTGGPRTNMKSQYKTKSEEANTGKKAESKSEPRQSKLKFDIKALLNSKEPKDFDKLVKLGDKTLKNKEKKEENSDFFSEGKTQKKIQPTLTEKKQKDEGEDKKPKDKQTTEKDVNRIPRRQLEAELAAAEETEKQLKEKKELEKPIKMLGPSQNLMTLDLVKINTKPRSTKKTLSEIMTLSEMNLHEMEHKVIKCPKCPLCNNSNLELEYEARKKRILEQEVMIRGREIRLVPAYKAPKEDDDIKPLLFQISYDDRFISKIIEPPKKEVPVFREQPEEKKVTKVEPEDASKGVIHYALSDRSFIEKGWTMLPTEKVVRKMNVYRMRPAHPEFDWFKQNRNKRLITYDTGERLAEFDDDGRGRWFYRNQRMALQYYDAEEINAQQRFVVFSNGEPDERGRSRPYTVLATFDYLGNGIVFDHGGKIRLKYNQTEGVVLDRSIGPASHWKWHTLNDPPVLQQVMIDTHMSHKDPKILKMGTSQDKSRRPDNEDMLAIEFDNFVKEKSKKLKQKFKPFQIRMKAMKINEHFSLKVLDQANVYLIYRDGTTNIKLNLGMLLDHKEIIDTDTAEVGEVANNMERLPARTDSLAAMQKSVAYAEHFEKTRTERDRRLNPPAPDASVDKLKTATSRPMRLPLRAAQSSTATTTTCICPKSRKPSNRNVYYDNRLF